MQRRGHGHSPHDPGACATVDEALALLTQASRHFGSLAELARALDTAPQRVYLWIAGQDLPTGEELERLKVNLRAIVATRVPHVPKP